MKSLMAYGPLQRRREVETEGYEFRPKFKFRTFWLVTGCTGQNIYIFFWSGIWISLGAGNSRQTSISNPDLDREPHR